jgi:hypothetical protein
MQQALSHHLVSIYSYVYSAAMKNIKTHDELITQLKTHGSISVIFMEKNKRRLKKCFDRTVKLEKILSFKNSNFYKIRCIGYGVYAHAREIFPPPRDKGFEKAIFVFNMALRNISSYEGKTLEHGKACVTFISKT